MGFLCFSTLGVALHITIRQNKKIIITDVELGNKEFSARNNVISFEVGNEYTSIILNNAKLEKSTMIAKFDFEKMKIVH